jgi:hypothetical protein
MTDSTSNPRNLNALQPAASTSSELSTVSQTALTSSSDGLVVAGREIMRLSDGSVPLGDVADAVRGAGSPITPAVEFDLMMRLEAHLGIPAVAEAQINGRLVEVPTKISEVMRMAKERGMTAESLSRRVDAFLAKKRYATFMPIEVLECAEIEDKVYDYDWYLAQAEVRDKWGNVTYDHSRRAGIERVVIPTGDGGGQPLFRPSDGKPVLRRYGFERLAPEPYTEPEKIEATALPEEIRAMINEIKQDDNGEEK